jgi:hypothetical protein
MERLTLDNTICSTWFERDRANVTIENKEDNQTLAEFWDETVSELVEDGFLDSRNFHKSAVEYLNYLWGL